MKILIIIPAYNEQENILNTVNQIKNYNAKYGTCYDIIVINDCSKDGTQDILNQNHIPHINLVHNLGIGGAVQTGYKYALDNDFDIAIQFDGDGQHDVTSVVNLIQPIIDGESDFVIGSRFVDKSVNNFKSSFARRIGIKLISFAIKIVTGKKIYDVTSGFRASSKKVIRRFVENYPIEYPEPITNAELLKEGYKVKEVTAQMFERKGGTSSIHSWKNAYYMFNILLSILVIGTRRYNK